MSKISLLPLLLYSYKLFNLNLFLYIVIYLNGYYLRGSKQQKYYNKNKDVILEKRELSQQLVRQKKMQLKLQKRILSKIIFLKKKYG